MSPKVTSLLTQSTPTYFNKTLTLPTSLYKKRRKNWKKKKYIRLAAYVQSKQFTPLQFVTNIRINYFSLNSF